MSFHVLLGHALDATKVRALHVALGTVEAFVESPATFGSYAFTAPHAGPRAHVLFVVLAFLKRYSQPTT